MAVTPGYRQTEEHLARRMASKAATLRARAKPFAKEWLIAKYITEGLDCVQIGAMVKRDPKSIWSWLKYYGIPTRPRGGFTSPHAFRIGAPNLFEGHKHTPATRQRLREIALADGRMPFKKENGPPFKGKYGAAHPSWKGGLTPERQAFYATDEWRESVKQVWKRADAKCERCGVHHNTRKVRGTFHIHHVVSFMVRELRASVGNLALLCIDCHHYVHSSDNSDGSFLGEQQC